jgi:predicted small lipoprotein YifL
MNKAIRTVTIIAAVASLVACGGKGGDKAATTTKKEAEKEMAWWYLFTGLTISDDSVDKPYPIIGDLYKKD